MILDCTEIFRSFTPVSLVYTANFVLNRVLIIYFGVSRFIHKKNYKITEMQDQKEIIFDIFYLFIIEKVKMLFSRVSIAKQTGN